MSDRLHPSDGGEPELNAPERLVAALRALHPVERPGPVPAKVDAAILAEARIRLGALAKAERTAGEGLKRPGDNGGNVADRSGRGLEAAEAEASRPLIFFPGWLAMAAGLALGVGLMFLLSRTEPRLNPVAWARGDLDGNGRLDMLDAFALARRLQGGGGPAGGGSDPGLDPGLDFNGDGVVDGKDVDWLAGEAVRLRKG